MDWFKGTFTGNHGFLTSKYMRFSCKFPLNQSIELKNNKICGTGQAPQYWRSPGWWGLRGLPSSGAGRKPIRSSGPLKNAGGSQPVKHGKAMFSNVFNHQKSWGTAYFNLFQLSNPKWTPQQVISSQGEHSVIVTVLQRGLWIANDPENSRKCTRKLIFACWQTEEPQV